MTAVAQNLSTDVLAAQRGDLDAFSRLVARYQNAAASVAMAIVRNASASQDIAQAAFVAAWRQRKKLRTPESFAQWLMQLVRREALQALRSDKRRGAREKAWHGLQSAAAPDAAELHDEHSTYLNLYMALDEVSDECREILLLYYREGRSAEQVGQLLSLSSSAVRKRLERARDVLRDRFESIEEAAKKTAPPAAFALVVLASIRASAAAQSPAPASVVMAKPWFSLALLIALLSGALFFMPRSDARHSTPGRAVLRTSVPSVAAATSEPDLPVHVAEKTNRARIDGRVRDHNGKPVRAMLVATAHASETELARMQTDEDGTFSVDDLLPGSYDLTASLPDHAERPRQTGITVERDGSYFSELEFQASAPATIRVIEDGGRPLVDYAIESWSVWARTNAEGVATLPRELPLGEVRVRIFEPDGRLYFAERVTHGRSKASTIVVPQTGELQIEAKFPPGREPKTLELVRIDSTNAWYPEVARQATFDPAQKASIHAPAGLYQVCATTPNDKGTRRTMPVKIRAGRVERLQMTTRAIVEHTVRVLDVDGKPAVGAMLFGDTQMWTADSEGLIHHITPDKYPLTAQAVSRARIATLTIRDTSIVEQTVTLNGSARVAGYAEGVHATESIAVDVSAPNGLLVDTLRFAGPSFMLADVPAGGATITVHTASGAVGQTKIAIEPGDVGEVRITTAHPGKIVGALEVTHGETPVPLPRVLIQGVGSRASADQFTFAQLPAGNYRIQVEVFDRIVAERAVTLAAGETLDVGKIELDARTFTTPRVFQDE